jgi:hypothetical protein
MPSPFRRAGVAIVLAGALSCLAAPPAALHAQTQTAIDSLLSAAGDYLEQLGRDLDGVVFEEDYFQQSQGQALLARRLKSDMAVLSDSAAGWVEFRDTASVDGKPVADRQTRVIDIFAHPSANALEQARRVVREGARFNISGVGFQINRTINLPMSALAFLRASNRTRSTFVRDGAETLSGLRMIGVTFTEISKPRLIDTPDEAAATGAFWIDPASGKVLRTTLRLETRSGGVSVEAAIQVDYGFVPALRLWLPKTMDDSYSVRQRNDVVGSIQGHAVYEHFRKFNVAVEEKAAN